MLRRFSGAHLRQKHLDADLRAETESVQRGLPPAFPTEIRAQPRNQSTPVLADMANLYYCAIAMAVSQAFPKMGAGPLAIGQRGTDTPMIHVIIQHGGCCAVALTALFVFSAWWRGHVHMRNVDRVCALIERQTACG